MGKIEKLKEVNVRIKNILIDLETYIFIGNINIDNKIIKEYKPKVVESK